MITDAILTSQQSPSGGARPFVVDWRRSLRDGRLPASTMAVGYTLAEYANGDGTRAYPGEKNLSRCVSLTERAVRRHLKVLLTAGWVTQESPGFPGHHAVYRLAIPSGIRPAPQQDRPAVGTEMSAVASEQRTVVTDEPGTATSGYQEPVQSPTTPYQDHELDGVALREKPSSLRSSKTTVDPKPVRSQGAPGVGIQPRLRITAETSPEEIISAYPDRHTDARVMLLYFASVVSRDSMRRWPQSDSVDVSYLAQYLDALQQTHTQGVVLTALVSWLGSAQPEGPRPGWSPQRDFVSTSEQHLARAYEAMKEDAADLATMVARDFPSFWPDIQFPKVNTHVIATTLLPLVHNDSDQFVDKAIDLWLEDKGGQPCRNPIGLFCSQIEQYVAIARAGRKPVDTDSDDEDLEETPDDFD